MKNLCAFKSSNFHGQVRYIIKYIFPLAGHYELMIWHCILLKQMCYVTGILLF